VRLCAWRGPNGRTYGAVAGGSGKGRARALRDTPFAGAQAGGLYAYEDPGMVGDRWGRAGAGMLFVDPRGRMLLLRRSIGVLEPGTWGAPGGAIPEEEYLDKSGRWRRKRMGALQSALKEVEEEVGGVPPHRVVAKYVYSEPTDAGEFTYTTFVAQVEQPFDPKLNWENEDWVWVKPESAWGLPLHFGAKAMLKNRAEWQPVSG